MPRTKRPARQQEKKSEHNDALIMLEKIVTDEKNKIDSLAQMEIRNVELAFKVLLGTISKNYLNKTISELKNELHIKDVPSTERKRHPSRSASHDDGYLTENSQSSHGDKSAKFAYPSSIHSSRASRSSRATCGRSRSAETSARKLPGTAVKSVRRRSRSVYKTPMYNKSNNANYPPITPKVAPQTPLMLLRQPRQGEMIVSMSGSPVMVPSCFNMQQEEKANCNIMLQDGTMLSLQPKEFRQSQAFIPYSLMDNNVLKQLKTLKDNLDAIVKRGEKCVK